MKRTKISLPLFTGMYIFAVLFYPRIDFNIFIPIGCLFLDMIATIDIERKEKQ